jgi:mannosyltransferase OCH1-like enzyme
MSTKSKLKSIDNQYKILIIIILTATLILILYFIFKKINEKVGIKSIEKMKEEYSLENAVIPFNIFQTWHTKDLPPDMAENVKQLKENNPEFEHYLFDDNDCREFIKQNFKRDVLYAFDALIPGAYKADLWRLCVLYIYGGIYMDIKLKCFDKFKLKYLTMNEHLVKEPITLYSLFNLHYSYSIYNAFMVCKPGNNLLVKCINEIVKNVQNKYYGFTPVDITGPNLIGKEYTLTKSTIPLDLISYTDKKIIYKNIIIIKHYSSYREEQKTHQKNKHYRIIWKERTVYNDNIKLV